MKYYFGSVSNMSLSFFGPVHITLILITFLSIFLLYKFRNKLNHNRKVDYVMVGILLINMAIFIIGAAVNDVLELNIHLPLHYCYITGYLFCYMTIFKKEKMFNFLFYAIFFAAMSAVIFQNPATAYDRYEFILLIISHHFILICSFYTLYIKKYKVEKSGLKQVAIYSVIVYSVVFVINQLIGTNYIFSDTLPLFIYDIFPFLSYLPAPIWLLIFVVPTCMISYIFVKYND